MVVDGREFFLANDDVKTRLTLRPDVKTCKNFIFLARETKALTKFFCFKHKFNWENIKKGEKPY